VRDLGVVGNKYEAISPFTWLLRSAPWIASYLRNEIMRFLVSAAVLVSGALAGPQLERRGCNHDNCLVCVSQWGQGREY
jgi:hypothetical protein